ncbi:uncharacterized protein LOC128546387 [Mercenaria mercenaria]|uniref:uncharacterized protein LOC128546387 n=1 Tax=Mercenaria mercenaria TaxID=6596 RepID=UPI00234E4A02|nr:uncharacterized protein LOC128546387 [Mercenaria mercenaria]
MCIIYLDFTLVLLCTAEIQGRAYYETEVVSSWNDSAGRCDLATPDLTFESGEYHPNIKGEDWNGHTQVWIGYFMAVQRFDYIGCLRTGGEKAHIVKQFNTPGICHSLCKSTDVIGIRGKECFCLLNEYFVNITQSHCDTICDAQKGIACGGHQHMSVYKIHCEKRNLYVNVE